MTATFEMVFDQMGFGRFNCKIMFTIGMFWMMEGMEMTLISLVPPLLKCEWKLSYVQTAMSSSALFIGMCVGHVYWGWLGDRHGRKRVLLTSSILVLYYALITAAAPSIYWFILLRFFVGIGVAGIASGICYLVEFSPVTHRARTIVMAQFFFAFGSSFVAFISYIAMNSLGWRVFLVLCSIPVSFVIALIPWLPESVRYLQNTGKFDDVMKVIYFISKENKVPCPSSLNIDCVISRDCGRISALFNKMYGLKLLVLCILWIFALWLYFGVILLNTQILQNRIYREQNTTSSGCYELKDTDYLQNLLVSFGEFPGIIFGLLIIEQLGRRQCLALFYIGTSICLVALVFPLSSIASTVVMFICRGMAACITQILYVMTTELFPTTIRNTALGFCIAVARCATAVLPFLMNILVRTAFVPLIATLAALGVFCSLICFLLPETRGTGLINR